MAPTEREAYDNDLRRFQADAKKQYAAWLASLRFRTRCGLTFWVPWMLPGKNSQRLPRMQTAASSF